MDPITILAAANAALALAETLIPKIKAMAQTGEISAEQQAQVLARFNSLKARGKEAFTGPEWAIEE